MDMDDAVRALEAYLDAELALTRAVFTEPDDAVVSARRRDAEALVHSAPGAAITLSMGRRPGMSAEEVAADAPRLAEYARRRLFKVVEHANPLWDRLFAGYASGPKEYTSGGYARLFYVAETDAGPRVVSVYDTSPRGETVQWTHGEGVVIDEPGSVVDVRRLVEPTRDRDLRDWTS